MSLSENEKELEILRHSTSHVMAQAVKRLFPDVKVAIGPAIENGFYYDFDKAEPFTQDDLGLIEEEMAKIIKEDLPIVREEIPREEAVAMFREAGEAYKAELIEDMPEDEVVSLYRQGEFVDLCRGPHLESTGKIKAFKLLSVAGAYWRGDEKNKMLQRIYGTAFPTVEELDRHLEMLKEAEKRDHRRLGRDLDIFSIHEEGGAGLVYWHPKGGIRGRKRKLSCYSIL
jgi:threonyl-tRNA synthetase